MSQNHQINERTGVVLQEADVCIIGSGPAALSVLSAIHEPYSQLSDEEYNRTFHKSRKHQLGSTKKPMKVCVVSPSDQVWLQEWEERFTALDIKYLRSPASAHPDAFSDESLLDFARQQGRLNEIIDVGVRSSKDFYGGRMTNLDTGLFDVPSQSLFIDFCRHLAAKIPHDFIQGYVTGIDMEKSDEETEGLINAPLRVRVRQQHIEGIVKARKVVVAIGPAGPRNIPKAISDNIPSKFYTHTTNVKAFTAVKASFLPTRSVLVVGGGLSTVQAAIAAAKGGSKVKLVSRRPLCWRHFDLDISWFDPRMQYKKRHDFYAHSDEDRPLYMKKVRGGGTVPPWYCEALEKSGVELIIGDIKSSSYNPDFAETPLCVTIQSSDGIRTEVFVDHIVCATGALPNSMEIPLLKSLHDKWPIKIVGGLPLVESNLRWSCQVPIYLVGGLAALKVGPDAANLMGARRSADIVADDLGVYHNIHDNDDVEGSIYSNAFGAFLDSDSSSDEEDDCEHTQ